MCSYNSSSVAPNVHLDDLHVVLRNSQGAFASQTSVTSEGI